MDKVFTALMIAGLATTLAFSMLGVSNCRASETATEAMLRTESKIDNFA